MAGGLRLPVPSHRQLPNGATSHRGTVAPWTARAPDRGRHVKVIHVTPPHLPSCITCCYLYSLHLQQRFYAFLSIGFIFNLHHGMVFCVVQLRESTDLADFTISKQFGRLTHYAFDAVLCESFPTYHYTLYTEKRLTDTYANSLRLPGRHQALHRAHVNTSLLNPPPPAGPRFPPSEELEQPARNRKKTVQLTWLIPRAHPWIGSRACGVIVSPSLKSEQISENKEVKRWIDNYLGVGEWVMDQSVAVMGSSSWFERRR